MYVNQSGRKRREDIKKKEGGEESKLGKGSRGRAKGRKLIKVAWRGRCRLGGWALVRYSSRPQRDAGGSVGWSVVV